MSVWTRMVGLRQVWPGASSRGRRARGAVIWLAAVLIAVSACGSGTLELIPSIAVSAAGASITVTQGQSATTTITVSRNGGFTGGVNLLLEGAPTGLTASFAPASIASSATTSTLTLAVSSSVAAGEYPTTVRAQGQSVTDATVTLSVVVTQAQAGSFALALAPTSLSVAQGASGTSTVTITRNGGFTGAVGLNVTGSPAGLTLAVNPSSVTRTAATITVTAAASLAAGTYTLTLQGTGSGVANQTATLTVQVTATAPSGHRVGIRTVTGRPAFYDRYTSGAYVPRGNQYVRLATLTKINDGSTITYHSTFNIGLYDAGAADAALGRMSSLGYTVVRVFIQGSTLGSIADPAGGLSVAYVANLADFLRRAKAHSVTVMLTTDFAPDVPPYVDLRGEEYPTFQGYNLEILSAGGVAAGSLFWADLVRALVTQGAPLDAVFAYELYSEYSFDAVAPPLNMTAGSVTAANGRTYDLSDPAAKTRLMTEGIVYYVDRVRSAILTVDPTALVTVGQFWPQGPNPTRPGDTRIALPVTPLLASTIDFLDLHLYPGVASGLSVAQLAENWAIPSAPSKPVIAGEYGANKWFFSTEQSAADALVSWEAQSCAYSFAGWILWTWDTASQPDGAWWYATEGSGSIASRLSPLRRPDPCTQ